MIPPYIISIVDVEAKYGDWHAQVGTTLPALGNVADGKRTALPATFLVKIASIHCFIPGETCNGLFGVLDTIGDEGEDGSIVPPLELFFFLCLLPFSFPTLTLRFRDCGSEFSTEDDFNISRQIPRAMPPPRHQLILRNYSLQGPRYHQCFSK
ncbi:hypothetical protein ACJIZ3_008094 [Penstemon smallii]|uniref:Uncharacterized protein n=1 Tax=Penstemon smallii TaxID=265156 RepID=A0ABD3TAR8_9LAMI